MKNIHACICAIILLSVVCCRPALAQTLAAGDIAVVGFNGSFNVNTTAPIGPDEFAIVALRTITAGTTIKLTDRGWNGTSMIMLTSEGAMSWAVSADIPAGTVFKFTITTGTTPSVTIAPTTYGTPAISGGWTVTTSPGAFASNGDEVIVYQGASDTNPANFVYGFNSSTSTTAASGNWQSGSSTNRDSDLPPGLTNNTAVDGTVAATALAFTNSYSAYNFVYTGTRTGTQTNLLKAIGNRANWTYTAIGTTTYDLNVGGTVFTGSNPAFTVTAALPVHLLSFTGQNTADGQLLYWKVENEAGFSHYTIEQSADGIGFTEAGTVPASGKSDYNFSSTKVQAQNYYRLKLVDRDGAFAYSNVLSLPGLSARQEVLLYPNPATDHIRIRSRSHLLGLWLTDAAGTEVLRQAAPDGNAVMLSIGTLPPGIYLVNIKTVDGLIVKKITKVR